MAKEKHHGGAWKVAYADFITSMMALFMVLWLTAQDTAIKEAIERSFKNPFSSLTKDSVGIIPNQDAQATHQEKGSFDSPSAVQLELLRRVTEDLAKLLQESPEDQTAVKLETTSDGLRINVFDRSRRPIFEPDTIVFTPYGGWVFSTMAWVVARYPNFMIELEGHTEAGRQPARPDYSAWELSADRANAARRKMVERGVAEEQIFKIAGFGDTQPMTEVTPKDETNRRVVVQLRIRSGDRLSGNPATPKPAPPPP